MDRLSTFQENDTRRLFVLAKDLNKRDFFKPLLNEKQHRLITYILDLDDFEIWSNFFEGNCYLTVGEKTDVELLQSGAMKNGEREERENNTQDAKTPDKISQTKITSDNEANEEDNQESDSNDLHDVENEKDGAELHSKSSDIQSNKGEMTIREGNRHISMLALHLRYLLWEKAIDFYYSSKQLDKCPYALQEVSEDYELIDKMDSLEDSSKKPLENVENNQMPVRAVHEEENDYDEEEDDEEPNDTKDLAVSQINGSQNKSGMTYNERGQLVLEVPFHVFDEKNDIDQEMEPHIVDESFNIKEQETMIKEYNKVYHSFEYDRETLIKRRKLEKSDKRLELASSESKLSKVEGNEASPNDGAKSDSVSINLGSASLSLRNLLQKIQSKRDQISLNDYELRTLFMDVRKNRGKWANDERIGQEELYEALVKVLLDLRGYTEHSTPFLNKVSKREAPNYSLIIKHPMDLNTVMKKLKTLQYNSKQEFVNDLMLIWNNCLTYNADPKHYLRAHAIAMQKRTIRLVQSIPNITIRNRSDVEKEEEQDNEEKSISPGTGKSSKKGRKTTIEEKPDSGNQSLEAGSVKEMENNNQPSHLEENKSLLEMDGKSMEDLDQENEEEDEEDEEMEIDQREENDENDEEDDLGLEVLAWRTWTAKSRAHYCAQRAALFDENNHLRLDAPAILRGSKEMSNFSRFLSNSQVISRGNDLLDNDEQYLLEYDVVGGLPGHPYEGLSPEEESRREQHLVNTVLQQVQGDASKLHSPFALSTESGLNHIYFQNINEMQEIRRICFKISLIRQMQTQQFVHHSQFHNPEIERLKEVDVDPMSQLPNRDLQTSEIQYAVLRRNVSKIVMQTGFETADIFAVNTLTQLAETYLGNLAKSLKMHSETTSSNRLEPKDVLLLSLLENGVDKPDDLYTFVKERIVKQLEKLKDLKQKLANFLKELLRPGLENFNENSFDDNSEQFMTGDFSSELGDDFFGFKELGLDKEFKMLSSSIPIYLLHSRLNNSFTSTTISNKRNKYGDLKQFKVPRLFASDTTAQIKILEPFYQKLLEKSKAQYIKVQKKKGESTVLPEPHKLLLTEDFELPQKQRNVRPRLPPTGKIASVKKKLVSSGFFLPDED